MFTLAQALYWDGHESEDDYTQEDEKEQYQIIGKGRFVGLIGWFFWWRKHFYIIPPIKKQPFYNVRRHSNHFSENL